MTMTMKLQMAQDRSIKRRVDRMQPGIDIKPIGIVRVSILDPVEMPLTGHPSVVRVFPGYKDALLRLEEHSHYWVLTWFDQARRDVLKTIPRRINPNLPEFGVFGLRSPGRPNPVGLSLVRLEKVEGSTLYVTGLDAVDGTPVIDIKPYFENDIVFSARTPHMHPARREILQEILFKQAMAYHQEECSDLHLAVRMTMLAEETFGHISAPDLMVTVNGSACLADTLQGLTRARLANPPRFKFQPAETLRRSTWFKDGRTLCVTSRCRLWPDDFWYAEDNEIFDISLENG